MPNTNKEIYARVENGRVTEYPVLPIHIKNRAHPFDWYTKVIFQVQPTVDDFQYLSESLSVTDGKVYCAYVVKNYTLAETLRFINTNPDPVNPDPDYVVSIEDVPPKSIAKVNELARAYGQTQLDEFAATRGYDGILSVCSYATDPLEEHRLEGQRAVDLRSAYWAAISDYMSKVLSKELPVPKTVLEITAHLPELTW